MLSDLQGSLVRPLVAVTDDASEALALFYNATGLVIPQDMTVVRMGFTKTEGNLGLECQVS